MTIMSQDFRVTSRSQARPAAETKSSLSTPSAWLISLGLALAPAVSIGIARFAYGLVLPAMRQDLSWTYTEAGWINTANAVGYLVGSIVAFRLVTRIGPRRLFIGGMILTTVALLATALTRNFWLLSFWRAMAGIGGAPAFIAGGAMASTLFKHETLRNAMAIAIYGGGGGLGMLVTGVSIPLILEHLGFIAWPDAWLLLGGLSLLATIPAALAACSIPLSAESNGLGATHYLPISRMSAALLGYFLFSVGYIVYLTFLTSWMRTRGVNASMIPVSWGLLGTAVMVSPLLWRRVLVHANGGSALAMACTATGLGTLLPMAVPGVTGLLLSAASFGASLFIAPTAVTSFSRKNLPEASWGRSLAVFTTVFATGQTLGPVAAGLIADTTNSLEPGLVAAGITLLFAGAVASRQLPLKGQ